MLRVLAIVSVLLASAGRAETPDDPFTIDASRSLRLSVGHPFERAEARERIGYLLEYWAGRFGIVNSWRGDRVFLTGKVFGVEVRAVFTVEAGAVQAIAYDPGTFLASAARGYVNRKLRKYLHPTYEEP